MTKLLGQYTYKMFRGKLKGSSFILGGLVLVFILLFITAIMPTVAILETTDSKFCGQCHEMKPIIESYLNSSHGGNNATGYVAECVSCHLPYDSTFDYLVKKAEFGIRHSFKHFFTDTKKIDWGDHKKNQLNYTYDSGCVKCHAQLQDQISGHDSYFEGKHESCLECHEVGHENLKYYVERQRELDQKEEQ